MTVDYSQKSDAELRDTLDSYMRTIECPGLTNPTQNLIRRATLAIIREQKRRQQAIEG